MRDLFASLMSKPTRETYLELRRQLIESEHYDPYSNDLQSAEEALGAENLEKAEELLRGGMPNLLLSPTAHLLISFIMHKKGDEQGSEVERYIAMACSEAMTQSGDGTQESPYLVLRTSDEYDLLRYLEKEFAGQGLVEKDGRFYDSMKCTDGEEIWFEITEMYAKLSEKLGFNDETDDIPPA